MAGLEREVFSGIQPRVYSTNPDNPELGRTFVYAKTEWFERVEGNTGAVAFTPFSDSETDLRERLPEQERNALDEMDDDYAWMVRDEFRNQTPLYPEAQELSNEPPYRQQDVT